MVAPDAGGSLDRRHPLVTAKALANGLCHVPAPASRTRDPVELLYQVLRKQQIRAHSHAHSIAHTGWRGKRRRSDYSAAMAHGIDVRDIDAWARRVLTHDGEAARERMLAELTAAPDDAEALLESLTSYRDPVVRAWAGTAARDLFGAGAVALLARLMNDRHPDVRDSAREDQIALDPAFEQTLLPAMRKVLERRKDPWGEDKAAMWRVARLRDTQSVPILRDYADHFEPRSYHHRIPLVLAGYIEDAGSITRRIRGHDHDSMFWLVQVARGLQVQGAEEAIADALALPVDAECVEIFGGAAPRDAR